MKPLILTSEVASTGFQSRNAATDSGLAEDRKAFDVFGDKQLEKTLTSGLLVVVKREDIVFNGASLGTAEVTNKLIHRPGSYIFIFDRGIKQMYRYFTKL